MLPDNVCSVVGHRGAEKA